MNSERPSRPARPDFSTFDAAGSGRARTAEHIGATARDLATQARAAGLTVLGLLLEKAAMTAGAEAMRAHWPKDGASS